MWKSGVLAVIITIVYLLFGYFQIIEQDTERAHELGVFLVPLVALGYFVFEEKKTIYFTGFILLFALSDLLDLFVGAMDYRLYYHLGNFLYILAYIFLLLEIIKIGDFNYLIKRFKIYFTILIVLDIYLVYVLQATVEPFVETSYEYGVELVYNIVMVALLSLALLNYIHKENNKAMYLFLGALLIVCSEVIWVAHTYIVEKDVLNILSMTLNLSAFFCFYKQVQFSNEEGVEARFKLD
ncbi:hypothetical protein F6U93_12690 [Tamlana haliotis]|uniref:YhhN-like protein n=1 Tax=Pseudotamlana haliotis TaxID=2614804 RepID=A0A6N6ME97_9FLAO|nr:hypothetical protein [Tamlana haliotis]KAB1067266.1 hypothetical protein F6U93_12690 [Tamlana haliotis]